MAHVDEILGVAVRERRPLTRRRLLTWATVPLSCCTRPGRLYGQTVMSFPDPQWRDAVLRLLAAISTSFGQPDYVWPKVWLAESDLPTIGAALATRSYRPEQWLQLGTAQTLPSLPSDKPPIDPKSEYRLLVLSALRQTFSRSSMRFDGIAFEDPFYALLACFNVGVYSKLLLLPRVSSVDQAWQQRNAIVSSLAKGSYTPDELFFECQPVGQNRTGLPMTAVTVPGALLEQTLLLGQGTFQDEMGFSQYALYEFVPQQ